MLWANAKPKGTSKIASKRWVSLSPTERSNDTCSRAAMRWYRSQNTKEPEFRFRALLTDDMPEVRFERAVC